MFNFSVGVVDVGGRRSQFQILKDILSLCLNGVRVTHLMYRANLSYSTLRRYLSSALEKGLVSGVKDSDGSVTYFTTEKGRLVLMKLMEVESAIG
jgi:predicted transcriptional regulator